MAKSVLFLLLVEPICQGDNWFSSRWKVPSAFCIFFLHMKGEHHQHSNRLLKKEHHLSRSSVFKWWGSESHAANQLSTSIVPRQHKYSLSPLQLVKWINNSCISSYLSKMASLSTTISNITQRECYSLDTHIPVCLSLWGPCIDNFHFTSPCPNPFVLNIT